MVNIGVFTGYIENLPLSLNGYTCCRILLREIRTSPLAIILETKLEKTQKVPICSFIPKTNQKKTCGEFRKHLSKVQQFLFICHILLYSILQG